jgi:hypothetical protein
MTHFGSNRFQAHCTWSCPASHRFNESLCFQYTAFLMRFEGEREEVRLLALGMYARPVMNKQALLEEEMRLPRPMKPGSQ